MKSLFRWGTGSTSSDVIDNRGYLFLESLLALSLSAAITIFYLSLVTTMLHQLQVEKSKVELSRAAYDLSRLEYTDDWQRKSAALDIRGHYDKNRILVSEAKSGESLEIILPNID